MPEFCLKKEIEKKLPTNDRFTIALILLCCNFCKKVHEKSEIDKYSKLFVEPLWISMKKEKHALDLLIYLLALEGFIKRCTLSA